MNTSLCCASRASRRLLAVGFLLTVTAWGLAQSATPPGQAKNADPTARAQEVAAARTGMGRAKDFAEANNLPAAESALTALNRAKPNTAAWHIETAQRLMQTAEQLARAGKVGSIPALAGSALQHLGQAELRAKDARIKASAKTLAGFIQERYLGNRATALVSYQAAAQLSPTAGRANEAAGRLQKTEENLRAKSAEGGR